MKALLFIFDTHKRIKRTPLREKDREGILSFVRRKPEPFGKPRKNKTGCRGESGRVRFFVLWGHNVEGRDGGAIAFTGRAAVFARKRKAERRIFFGTGARNNWGLRCPPSRRLL